MMIVGRGCVFLLAKMHLRYLWYDLGPKFMCHFAESAASAALCFNCCGQL
jgi:hypothetical protein